MGTGYVLVLVLCASAMFTLREGRMYNLEDDFSHSTDLTLGLNPLNVLEATDTNSETRNNLNLSELFSLKADVRVLEAGGHDTDHPNELCSR